MRRPLLTVALIGSLTLALLIGAALLIGLVQPPTIWGALLRLDDCQLPCWIGIEPGMTTLAEAQQQVQLAYADNSAYRLEDYGSGQFAVNDNRSHYRIGITLDAGDDPSGERQTVPPTVQQIRLWADVIPSKRVNFFDLYSTLGTAEAVQSISIGGVPYLMIFYRHQHVGLATNAFGCNAVSPAQKIYLIILSARSIPDYLGWVSAPSPWLGFRRCHDLPSPFAS